MSSSVALEMAAAVMGGSRASVTRACVMRLRLLGAVGEPTASFGFSGGVNVASVPKKTARIAAAIGGGDVLLVTWV
jgi:hypothetical protein